MKETSIGKNYIYSVLYQILAIIIPLITSPYLTRTIAAKDLGIYSYSYSFASYFVLFIMLGLNNYGNRAIARVRDDKEKTRKTFWEIYTFQLILLVLVSAVYFIWITITDREDLEIYLLQYLIVLAAGLDVNWCCFGLEKFKLTVTRNAIVKIVSTIAIFLFVRSGEDLWKYTLIASGSTLINQFAIWPFILRNIKYYKPTIKGIVSHIKPNLTLFLPVIAVSLYTLMDKIMLGILTNKEIVAYYTYAEKIIMIPRSFIIALGTVILPRASNTIKKGRKEENIRLMNMTMQFSLIFSAYCLTCLVSISNTFIPWFYGANYIACSQLVILLSPLIVMNAWNNTIRTQYVIPSGLDKTYLATVACGAITNLILNLLLIPRMAGEGAIIATLGAELAVCVTQFILLRKKIRYIDYCRQLLIYLMMSAIVLLVNIFLNNSISDTILNIIFHLILSSALYLSLVLLYLCRVRKDYILINKILSTLKVRRSS